MTPTELAARALMISSKGGRDLEVRIRFQPEGRIVRGGLGQQPKQEPITFTAGIYEVGEEDFLIEAKAANHPDQALGGLALMIVERGTHWFIPGDRQGLQIVPDDDEESKSVGDETKASAAGGEAPPEDGGVELKTQPLEIAEPGPDEHGDDPPPAEDAPIPPAVEKPEEG